MSITTARHDGRAVDALREIRIETGYIKDPAGSVLIHMGDTRVLCNASIEDKVPHFLNGSGQGWVTAEYAMLPSSTGSRMQREVIRGRQSGRTMEIQRLIGRALRAVVDRKSMGERTIWIDCDVLQADGGTRTASITGAFVAMSLALGKLSGRAKTRLPMLTGAVAAISVGVVEGEPVLDLDYVEDSAAEVDLNVVRTEAGKYVELQGTAETTPFDREAMNRMIDLADQGIDRLLSVQRETLGELYPKLIGKA